MVQREDWQAYLKLINQLSDALEQLSGVEQESNGLLTASSNHHPKKNSSLFPLLRRDFSPMRLCHRPGNGKPDSEAARVG